MMFGVVKSISEEEPEGEPRDPATEARVELYHRSRRNRDVFAHSLFSERSAPEGFWFETRTLPGRGGRFPVLIHHKFVIVDAETDHPTIFTGSANMSKSALYNNDENLLEITECPRLARMYLAEFMRLYEHYRARAIWKRFMEGRVRTFKLRTNSSWTGRAYKRGTREYRSRVSMVGG
jgi:phosphatidylserine/phosphatidylglycerophosphate/cardiolipin synthase-like enzyme